MTDNNKTLVSAGHELASELKADCGAVDMRSVANLLTELASALDVQSARSDALAAENAALKSGGCELLGEACAVYAKLNKLIDPEIDDFIDGQTLHEFQFLLDTGTPATDACVNEQRAAGVDMVVKYHMERAKALKEVDRKGSFNHSNAALDAGAIAEQLRGGQV